MNQRARLDVAAGLSDGPAVLAHGVPGFHKADGHLMSTRNQLADVHELAVCSGIARFGRWLRREPRQTDTFARFELANGHRHIVGRIDQVIRRVSVLAQCSILPRKPVSLKGPPDLLSSPR